MASAAPRKRQRLSTPAERSVSVQEVNSMLPDPIRCGFAFEYILDCCEAAKRMDETPPDLQRYTRDDPEILRHIIKHLDLAARNLDLYCETACAGLNLLTCLCNSPNLASMMSAQLTCDVMASLLRLTEAAEIRLLQPPSPSPFDDEEHAETQAAVEVLHACLVCLGSQRLSMRCLGSEQVSAVVDRLEAIVSGRLVAAPRMVLPGLNATQWVIPRLMTEHMGFKNRCKDLLEALLMRALGTESSDLNLSIAAVKALQHAEDHGVLGYTVQRLFGLIKDAVRRGTALPRLMKADEAAAVSVCRMCLCLLPGRTFELWGNEHKKIAEHFMLWLGRILQKSETDSVVRGGLEAWQVMIGVINKDIAAGCGVKLVDPDGSERETRRLWTVFAGLLFTPVMIVVNRYKRQLTKPPRFMRSQTVDRAIGLLRMLLGPDSCWREYVWSDTVMNVLLDLLAHQHRDRHLSELALLCLAELVPGAVEDSLIVRDPGRPVMPALPVAHATHFLRCAIWTLGNSSEISESITHPLLSPDLLARSSSSSSGRCSFAPPLMEQQAPSIAAAVATAGGGRHGAAGGAGPPTTTVVTSTDNITPSRHALTTSTTSRAALDGGGGGGSADGHCGRDMNHSTAERVLRSCWSHLLSLTDPHTATHLTDALSVLVDVSPLPPTSHTARKDSTCSARAATPTLGTTSTGHDRHIAASASAPSDPTTTHTTTTITTHTASSTTKALLPASAPSSTSTSRLCLRVRHAMIDEALHKLCSDRVMASHALPLTDTLTHTPLWQKILGVYTHPHTHAAQSYAHASGRVTKSSSDACVSTHAHAHTHVSSASSFRTPTAAMAEGGFVSVPLACASSTSAASNKASVGAVVGRDKKAVPKVTVATLVLGVKAVVMSMDVNRQVDTLDALPYPEVVTFLQGCMLRLQQPSPPSRIPFLHMYDWALRRALAVNVTHFKCALDSTIQLLEQLAVVTQTLLTGPSTGGPLPSELMSHVLERWKGVLDRCLIETGSQPSTIDPFNQGSTSDLPSAFLRAVEVVAPLCASAQNTTISAFSSSTTTASTIATRTVTPAAAAVGATHARQSSSSPPSSAAGVPPPPPAGAVATSILSSMALPLLIAHVQVMHTRHMSIRPTEPRHHKLQAAYQRGGLAAVAAILSLLHKAGPQACCVCSCCGATSNKPSSSSSSVMVKGLEAVIDRACTTLTQRLSRVWTDNATGSSQGLVLKPSVLAVINAMRLWLELPQGPTETRVDDGAGGGGDEGHPVNGAAVASASAAIPPHERTRFIAPNAAHCGGTVATAIYTQSTTATTNAESRPSPACWRRTRRFCTRTLLPRVLDGLSDTKVQVNQSSSAQLLLGITEPILTCVCEKLLKKFWENTDLAKLRTLTLSDGVLKVRLRELVGRGVITTADEELARDVCARRGGSGGGDGKEEEGEGEALGIESQPIAPQTLAHTHKARSSMGGAGGRRKSSGGGGGGAAGGGKKKRGLCTQSEQVYTQHKHAKID